MPRIAHHPPPGGYPPPPPPPRQYKRAAAPSEDNRRHSNYLITISTNVRPRDAAHQEQLSNALDEVTHSVFDSDANLERLIRFNKPHHHYSDQYIQNIAVRSAAEVGTDPRGGRVHTHVNVRINHTSNITMKYSAPMIKQLFMDSGALQALGVKNLYIKIQLIADIGEAIKKYLSKQQATHLNRAPTTSIPPGTDAPSPLPPANTTTTTAQRAAAAAARR